MEQVAFLEILTFIVGALVCASMGSWVSALLRPQRPNTEKLDTYESGEKPTGSAWKQFNSRFYGIAIVFMLFEVETVLLYPWATVWANPALKEATGGLWVGYTAASASLFIILLAIGLVYVWRQGHLAGLQPALSAPSFVSDVPRELYDQINRRYAGDSHQNNNPINQSTSP